MQFDVRQDNLPFVQDTVWQTTTSIRTWREADRQHASAEVDRRPWMQATLTAVIMSDTGKRSLPPWLFE
jgi:hypothetical protein